MTNDRLEVLLALGIVLVYLLDSMRLLGHREALVERLALDRWKLSFGSVRIELFGRRPALPNPLRPDRMLWLAHWRLADVSSGAAGKVVPPAADGWARAIGYLSLILLLVVVILAPAMLLIGENQYFAAAIGIGYLLAIAGAALLVLRAAEFGLRRSAAFGTSLISVLCLPCAPNLLRAACGGRTLDVELPDFGERSAGVPERKRFQSRFTSLLRHESWLSSGDPERNAEIKAVLRRYEVES
ncbi:MAG: hypothetical protein ACREVZ_09365 [Burkholderiales bacterium]